jgi:hypothetical protein
MFRRGLSVSDAALRKLGQITSNMYPYSHGDKLHSLVRERSLNDHRHKCQEAVRVDIAHETGTIESAWMFPELVHTTVSLASRVDGTSRRTLKPVRSWLGPPPRSMINPDSRRAIIKVTMSHCELGRCEERNTHFLSAKNKTRLVQI